jgi:ferredoxin
MSYTVTIDAAACAAHGDCADIAPDVFAIDDVAVVIGAGPDDLLVEAATMCPSVAIVVTDERGAQVYP